MKRLAEASIQPDVISLHFRPAQAGYVKLRALLMSLSAQRKQGRSLPNIVQISTGKISQSTASDKHDEKYRNFCPSYDMNERGGKAKMSRKHRRRNAGKEEHEMRAERNIQVCREANSN